MKKGIVFKLFVLTTALCLLILAIIYFGQTVFFKRYYVHQKVKNVKASLEAFAQNYVNQDKQTVEIGRLEQEFYREHNTWVTVLDQFGSVKASIAQRIDSQAVKFKDYRPDEYALLEKHVLKVKSHYVLFAVSVDAEQIEKAFDEALKQK